MPLGRFVESIKAKLTSVIKSIGGGGHVEDLWATIVDTVISIVPIVRFHLVFQLAVLRYPF